MYAQLQQDGTWRELRGNIVFSDTVYQTAESLTDAQRVQFNVYQIVDAERPVLQPNQKFGDPGYAVNGRTVTRSYAVVPKTAEELAADTRELIASITAQTQERLDAFARTRNYDDILSACTYASSTVPKFQVEGQYCVDARDATWAALYQIMTNVEVGQQAMPTSYADVEPFLPSLEWPA